MIRSLGQKAVIVQVEFPNRKEKFSSLNAFEEFKELVLSSGAEISCEHFSKQSKATSGLFLTKGKTESIKDFLEKTQSELVIFNHDLTPSQERNLENIFKARVLDRTGLILDIFSTRAKSHVGKLQVELAQLSHLSTRLVRGWSHLERQKGGIGLRGPGETQLETDKRLINQRIKSIKKKLNKSHNQRKVNRYSRSKSKLILVAMVGYTNAGKTTLFNLLTDNNQYAVNKPFATLDSVTRRNSLSGLDDVLFSDTVGFISDLPTHLIESFKTTLDELKAADLLIHVIDISDPDYRFKVQQVSNILEDLDLSKIPQIQAHNKCDKTEIKDLQGLSNPEKGEVWISAENNIGINELKKAINLHSNKVITKQWIKISNSLPGIRSKLYSLGRVIEERTTDLGLIQLHLEIEEMELEELLSNKGIQLDNTTIKEAI